MNAEGINTWRRVVFLCLFIAMIDGYDTIMPSFVAPLVAREFDLQIHAIGRLFAIGYFGAIAGALLAGELADYIGRKYVLLVALTFTSAATLACAGATSFHMLLALRFLAGLGLGGAMPCLTALTGEHAPVERRPAMVTLMFIGYPLGAVVGGMITSYFLQYGWQAVFLGGGIAALLTLPLTFFIPETLISGRTGMPAASQEPRKTIRIGGQFAEGRLGAAMMVWIGQFCMLLVVFLMLSWTPTLAVRSGISPQTAALSGVLFNLGGAAGALALRAIVNRRGPFMPAAVVVAASAVLIVLLGRSFGSVPLLMSVLALVGFTALGGELTCPAMVVELFPAHVRGAGAGWALATGRIGSIVGPLIGSALLAANYTLERLFAVLAVPAAVAAVAFAVADRIRPKPQRRAPVGDVGAATTNVSHARNKHGMDANSLV